MGRLSTSPCALSSNQFKFQPSIHFTTMEWAHVRWSHKWHTPSGKSLPFTPPGEVNEENRTCLILFSSQTELYHSPCPSPAPRTCHNVCRMIPECHSLGFPIWIPVWESHSTGGTKACTHHSHAVVPSASLPRISRIISLGKDLEYPPLKSQRLQNLHFNRFLAIMVARLAGQCD